MNTSQLEALSFFLSSRKSSLNQSKNDFRLNRNTDVIPEFMRINKQAVLKAVIIDGYALRNSSTLLCSDREVVMAAVSNKGLSLLFASCILKADKEIVLMAIKNNCYSIKFASEVLRNDLEFIYEAYSLNSNIIKYIEDKIIKQLLI